MTAGVETVTGLRTRTQTRHRPGTLNKTKGRLISAASVILLLTIWQLTVDLLDISSYLFPPPSEVAQRLWTGLQPGPASYYPDIQVTLAETFWGFGIAVVVAVALAVTMAHWPVVERVVSPYVFGMNALPKIAIAPLLILWVGFGTEAMITVAAAVAFFPMLVNSLAGFKSVPTEQATMMRGLCASPAQTFFRLKLPAASPMLVAGVELALVYAFLGAIAGEFLGGQEGLGVRIVTYASTVDVAGEFAILALLCAIAIAMRTVLAMLRKRLLFWTPSEIAEQES